jgi:hypothetical protein
VDRRSLLDNLDLLMLTVDELVDGGTILETDSTAIVSRVLMYGRREGGREERREGERGSSGGPSHSVVYM